MEKDGFSRAAPLGFAGTALLVELVVLVLVQGGYFGTAVCACGVVSWLVYLGLALQWRTLEGFGLAPALFLALALCYAVSLFANGFDLTGASETGTWFAVAGAGALVFQMEKGQRAALFECIAVFGGLYALVGIAVFVAVPDADLVRNGRLEMSFEYANAAAAFLAVCFWLGITARHRWVRFSSLVTLAGLAFTQSGGAAAAFCAAGAVAAGVWAWRQRRILQSAAPWLRAVLGVAAVLALVCIALGAAWALFPDRLHDALATFAERGLQVRDGLAMLAGAPLLGIGPDSWQFLYPYSQTAQYRVSVVHCSWLQIALDSGVLGLAALVAAVVMGARSQVLALRGLDPERPEDAARFWEGAGPLLALLFLTVHSLLDFDLQFGSLAVLFALLATGVDGPVLPRGGRAAECAASIACAVVCLLGACTAIPQVSMAGAIRSGNVEAALERFESDPLAQSDVPLQNLYLDTVLQAADYGRVQAWCDAHGVASDEQALAAYRALYAVGTRNSAATILLEQLEAQPYNRGFYNYAIEAVSECPLDEAQESRFEVDVRVFNERARAASAAGLPRQRTVNLPE